jgi:hypoxanthine phosphoribosyltransferase
MGLEGNKELYRKVIDTFDNFSSRDSKTGLEQLVSRAHYLFLGGFVPSQYPSSDFGKQIVGDLAEYGHLLSLRKKIDIAGGEREVSTETEAYQSLILVSRLAENLILPHFHTQTDFSNKIFNDIYNLGLSYLHGIIAAVANQYIDEEEAFDAKSNAVKIASRGIRLYDAYHRDGGKDKQLVSCVRKLSRSIKRVQPEFLRSFELVPTSQKKIYHGQEIMKALVEEISDINEKSGEFLFKPNVIFPIAQGANEFGLRIAHAYQDKGYSPLVYPLFYSIKTRKHRAPWVSYDSKILGKQLEGQDLLVVEDWVTTGNTLRGILYELDKKYPRELRVATIKRDPSKSKIPALNNYHFYVGQWTEYTGQKVDSLRSPPRKRK